MIAARYLLLIGLPMAGAAMAQGGDTRPIQVTATVKASCRFDSTPNINFGDLDPAAATDKSQTVQVSFKCTRGVWYNFVVERGLNYQGGKRRMKNAAGNDFIAYDIDPVFAIGRGSGFETSESLALEGRVKGADYRSAPVGTYADTVRISIQP